MSWHLISSLAGLTSLGCMIWFSLKNEIKHTYFHVADKLNPYTIDCKCLVSGRRVMSCAKCNGSAIKFIIKTKISHYSTVC